MAWPQAVDYRDAIQQPKRAFRDPRLQSCTAEKNRLGVPSTRSGARANVYKLSDPSGTTTAVRVFLSPNPDRERRYQVVDTHLRTHKPSCIVDFSYQSEGIVVGGNAYPIMTMEWVSGQRFSTWMEQKVADGDTDALRAMADRWAEVIVDLRDHNIAHGDLQHGNILVVGNDLVLVDYDCMCVPQLVGQPALEEGLPAYQHPKRPSEPLSLELDHFPAWIIFVALRAVAADLTLWKTYVEDTQNENMLFSEQDLLDPGNSTLWADLANSPDPEVADWASELFDTLLKPFEEIEPFGFDPFGPLEDAAKTRNWIQLVQLAGKIATGTKPVPPHLVPLIDEARKRLEARDRLSKALQGSDPRKVKPSYAPQLLDDWDDCEQLVADAKRALHQVSVLDQLQAACKAPGNGRPLVALWAQHAAELQGIAEADRIRETVDQWARKIDSATQFLHLLSRSQSTVEEIAEAWEALEAEGGHPDVDSASEDRGREALKCARCLWTIQAIPPDETEMNDRRLLDLWDDQLLQGIPGADPYRIRMEAASERIQALEVLAETVSQVDAGQASDEEILKVAEQLPLGYAPSFSSRIQQAELKLESLQALQKAIDAVPQLDLPIADAWENAQNRGFSPNDPVTLARCRLAVQRRNALERLQAISGTIPLDQQDQQWLSFWDDRILNGCYEALGLRPRFEVARDRDQAWYDFKEAMDQRDAARVRAIVQGPVLQGYPPLQPLLPDVEELLEISARIATVIDAIASGNDDTLERELDLAMLRFYPREFAPYRHQIESWITDRVMAQQLRTSNPEWIPEPGNKVRVRWVWHPSKLIDHCRIAHDQSIFFRDPIEAEQYGGTMKLSRADYSRNGGCRLQLLHSRLCVTIWPVVDLGWGELTGRPLQIGPISSKPPSTRSTRDRWSRFRK